MGSNLRQSSPWDMPGIEDKLRELHAQGLSCRRIATELNVLYPVSLSRNAVIGKCSRLGMPERKAPAKVGRREKKRRGFTHDFRDRLSPLSTAGRIVHKRKLALAGLQPGAEALPDDDTLSPPETRKTLLELEPNDCRWPYGDSNFTFCAKPVKSGHSWCQYHYAIANGVPPAPNTFRCEAAEKAA